MLQAEDMYTLIPNTAPLRNSPFGEIKLSGIFSKSPFLLSHSNRVKENLISSLSTQALLFQHCYFTSLWEYINFNMIIVMPYF